jgi:ribosomal protein L7/L12
MKVQFDTLNDEDVRQAWGLVKSLGAADGDHLVMSLETLTELMHMARLNKKILCIKQMRAVYSLGLREAKEWCEANLHFGYSPE